MTSLRALIAALVLLGGILATHNFRPIIADAPQRPLREFPSDIGISHSEDRPFENPVVQAIGADDYINRVYLGSAPPIELYRYYKINARATEFILPELPSGRLAAGPFHTLANRTCKVSSCCGERLPGGERSEAGYGPLLVPVPWTDCRE
jgi:hypothetical protein